MKASKRDGSREEMESLSPSTSSRSLADSEHLAAPGGVSSSHDDDHEFLVQSNVDMNDRGVDVLLTNLGVGCVAASASIFVFVAARRLVASRRAGGGYERVPEPELDL